MKKILALLCGLVFASGAWAYTYNFRMDITCPTEFTKMSDTGSYYLLNTATHECYVYWAGSNWGNVTTEGTTIKTAETIQQVASSFEYDGQIYKVIAGDYTKGGSEVINAAGTTEGTKKVTFVHQLESEHQIKYADLGEKLVSGVGAVADNLLLVINDPAVENRYNLSWGDITITSDGHGTLSQATGFGEMTVVPEPTSGVLLLLGMAGLALRRRKVA